MKTALLIVLIMVSIANAGPIKTMFTNDPDQIQAIIDNAPYTELLKFIRDAYNESKAENGDPGTEYVWKYALGSAPLEKQIPLSVDFALDKPELEVKELGATIIVSAVFRGIAINAEKRQEAIAKLKAALTTLAEPNIVAYQFARKAGEALVVLGDDAGLDIFLTDKETGDNYSRMDNWTRTSDAAVFEALKQQYQLKAADINNMNEEIEKIMAATYELCRIRRTQSKEIKPLNPLVNLQNLLP